MIQKHAVLAGLILAFSLLMIAIQVYPGGSMFDEYAVGFDWNKNFISNLFGSNALNGADNPSRYWAYAGMIVLPASYAIFFHHMAKKLPDPKAANFVKFLGVANVLFTFLTITRYHDLMLNISISLFWTCIVVITISIFKTRLLFFKLFCVVCLVIFYYSIYLWATSNWPLLPLVQKVNFITSTLLVLALEYFTSQQDFAPVSAAKGSFDV